MKNGLLTSALFFTIVWLFEIAKGNLDIFVWIRLGIALVLWLIYAAIPQSVQRTEE